MTTGNWLDFWSRRIRAVLLAVIVPGVVAGGYGVSRMKEPRIRPVRERPVQREKKGRKSFQIWMCTARLKPKFASNAATAAGYGWYA
jgi:hypothetical protein